MGLDLSKASRIYGSARATWFLNGRYYTHDGQEVSEAEAAAPNADYLPPPAPLPQQQALPSYTVSGESPRNAPPPGPLPSELPAAPVQSDATRLRKMSAEAVITLVEAAGGKPFLGYGAKKKNMAWLLKRLEKK